MALLSNTGIRAGASGATAAADDTHRIKRSARFNDGDSAYLNWTPAAEGDSRQKWTWSGWVKRTTTGSEKQGLFGIAGSNVFIRFNNDDGGSNLRVLDSGNYDVITNRKFRDNSAWYHIVVVLDTTQATDTNRIKIYVNGERETSFHSTTWPGQNDNETINSATGHVIGVANTDYYDGYLANVHFIDGTAKEPADFAETNATTGQWVPKEYDGSYGTNGFHLAMDPANGGTNWSIGAEKPYNTDHTSYPISQAFNGSLSTYAMTANSNGDDANLVVNLPGLAASKTVRFYGYKNTNAGTLTFNGGAVNLPSGNSSNKAWVTAANQTNGSSDSFSMNVNAGSSISDDLGVYAVEVDGKILVDHTTIGYDSSGNDNHWHENNLFGNEHTIANENFKVVTYDGLGTGNAKTITLGFKPDLVWTKSTSHGDSHSLCDSVRGVSKSLISSSSAAQTSTAGSFVTSFNTDGYTLGNDPDVNGSSTSYVAWCWKAGGAASALNTGSINASVSANTAAGFSIVKYTGIGNTAGTIAHGLGKAPELIIVKDIGEANDWAVYHVDVGATKDLELNTNAVPTTRTMWNDTAPTSTVFSVGAAPGSDYHNRVNKSGNEYIAYCWTSIDGYSKFSSFVDPGAMRIELGFWPGLWINKRTDAANAIGDGWGMFDKHRSKFDNALWAQDDGTGGTGWANAENPNGFSWGSGSYSDGDYISMAWAGDPAEKLDLLADAPGAPYDNELNGGGNYATLNPLDSGSGVTLSDGNLKAYIASDNHCAKGNFGMSSGKWYWEINITQDGNNTHGIAPTDFGNTNWCGVGDSLAYNGNNGQKYTNSNGSAYGATHGTNDVIGTAFDADSGSLTFYKNGVSQGVAWSDVDMTKTWVVCCGQGASTHTYNFGQRTFAYTPPTGYKALNTYNLTDPTIIKSNTGFDVKTYEGDADEDRAFTDYNMGPDLVWTKDRGVTYHHILCDSVRGSAKKIASNLDDVENDGTTLNTSYGYVDTFDTNGYTLGGGTAQVNTNNSNLVAYAWDAGTANVSKSAGDLNSTVYNQEKNWSTYLSAGTSLTDAAKAFDGVWTQAAGQSGETARDSGANGSVTFDVSSAGHSTALTGPLEIYSWVDALSGTSYTRVDVYEGGSGTASAQVELRDATWANKYAFASVGTFTNITKIIVNGTNSGGAYLGGVKVGGKELIDTSVTPTNVPSIASEYRVNTETGFSIVNYTVGSNTTQTVAHGLNAKPDFIMVKELDQDNHWQVYHKSKGNTGILYLNLQNAFTTSNTWNDTDPTSSVFSVVSGGTSNFYDGKEHIAYCWSGVSGYSKFGSYEGNNDSNGPFVWCGFRPKWILIKGDIAGEDWCIVDSVKEANDGSTIIQFVNENATEYESGVYDLDILSNGFKLRNTNPRFNTGNTYLFAAFADSPFKYANAF